MALARELGHTHGMSGLRAHGPSANPRPTWGLFGAVSAAALVIGLLSAIASGDRVTVVVTVWGVLVGIAGAAVILYLIMTPLPNESEMWGSASSGRGTGSSGWAMGFSDGGFGDGGGGGGGGGGDGGGC